MHLKLALSAARIEDTDEAIHHIEHLVELAPSNEEAAAVLSLLRDGEIVEAEHHLEALLGGEPAEDEQEEADEHAHEEGEDKDAGKE